MSESETREVVLVIDDTAENLALISEVLRGEFKVKVAPGGARGLQLAQASTPPDLILLDIMMPEMDGYEVLRQLRTDPRTRDIPVIFLTAMSSVEEERRGLELGAVDYITKPISPPLVQSRVRNHLQLKAARDFLKYKSEFLEREVQRRTREVTMIQEVTIRALASLAETRDNDTGNHILRTQHYVKLLAQKLARHPRFAAFLTEGTIDLLFKSAPLHDIGKIGIPDRILLKAGKLTPDEFEIMKMHTTLGGNAIANAELAIGEEIGFLRYAKEIAYSHQEWWDGSGYPKGLKGEEIPISARLMAVADVYDALINKRVYKRAISHEEAVQVIREGRGTHFDPDVVDAFLGCADGIREIANRYKESSQVLVRQAERMITDLGGEEIEM
ncbi:MULTISPECIES: response regulator [Rhodanobacter]|uniref:Response regulator containing a CheY-like receiver domain and an HD-GYP domain n=2 Tax=Rhodanobacter TaxID=75309 RepID=I4W1K9_9GAMM|nr:two-component system response regulator [Rhodanobacter spathiphylli]EIL93350.1 response regulator containing a CheY-like receiver domain and an HD-GYP domain [Rhodanobacter spathiphylli B39]